MIEVIEVSGGSAGPGYVARGGWWGGSRWWYFGFGRFRRGRWVWDLPMVWEISQNAQTVFSGSASFLLNLFFDFKGDLEYEEIPSAQNPRFAYGLPGSVFSSIGILSENGRRLE